MTSIPRAHFDTERVGTPTGSYAAIGTPLTASPTLIIFDNQSTAPVELSVDGVHTWKTFPASEALVLDLTTNSAGVAIATQFYIKGAGAGTFNISIIYAG